MSISTHQEGSGGVGVASGQWMHHLIPEFILLVYRDVADPGYLLNNIEKNMFAGTYLLVVTGGINLVGS